MRPRFHLIQKRKDNHLTQNAMAEFLGVTARHYRLLEAGTSDGSVKIWQQLAQKFGTTIDYLLKQEPDSAKDSTQLNCTTMCNGEA
ncbi:hypothetical protein FACS1894187_05490 [Synergistales bacterium]|nr:hypothetical protein FACS1894187_05490 [Synergistales bacterium]